MAIFDSAGRGYNLSTTGNARDAEQVSGLRVTAGFFKVLGVTPFLGRTFLKEEETLGKDHEVVLSYGLWQRRYGADPTLVGRSIRIDGDDFIVVGVMPRDFQWEFWSGPRQLWVPVGYNKTDFGRGSNSFLGIARLRPGVTVDQARAEMQAVGARIAAAYPKDDVDMGATAIPIDSIGMKGIRSTLLTLLGAVAFVLLIACVNVANLLLSRGAARQKEFAIRRALGAGGARIARQMLTESVLLALAGGAAGLAIAFWSTRLLFQVFKLDGLHLPLRVVDSIPMDGRVFAFALAVSCITGILFGIAPALSVGRGDVNDTLKEGGRGSSSGGGRLRHTLVACEVALALMVLCGAGLMIKSMTRLLGVDPGLNPKNVLAMTMTRPAGGDLRRPSRHTQLLSGSGGPCRRDPGRRRRRRGRPSSHARRGWPFVPDRRTPARRTGTFSWRQLHASPVPDISAPWEFRSSRAANSPSRTPSLRRASSSSMKGWRTTIGPTRIPSDARFASKAPMVRVLPSSESVATSTCKGSIRPCAVSSFVPTRRPGGP